MIAIIISIPLAIIMVQKKSNPVKSLVQSEVVNLLDKNKITEWVWEKENGITVSVSGKYLEKPNTEPIAFRAKIHFSDELEKKVYSKRKMKVDNKDIDNAFMNILIMLFPIFIIILIAYFIFLRPLKNSSRGAMQFGKSRARMVQNLDKITFDDVAGIDGAKEEVVEIVDYLKNPGKFHLLGGRMPHGILLSGPPGTGKTLLARAIAGEAEVPFFSISGSDFVEMFVGVGASRVRDMFEQAKKSSPCIIFIDEIDAVGRSRFSGHGGGHDEREQTLNALLVEMDGFEANSGIVVVAATNRADVLDTALLRPGRFDRQVAVELPDLVGRKEILVVHLKKIKTIKDLDIDAITRSTPGFSGADLANLVNEAALQAVRKSKSEVENDDFEEAHDKVRYGKERPFRAMSEAEKKMTAYHEAGHALASLYCEEADPLHKVSIIPRGKMLGGAMYYPKGDKVSYYKKELMERMIIAVGGRCAEEIFFGENKHNSGAAGDIEQCSSVARAMVCDFGMSEKLGFIKFSGDSHQQYPQMAAPIYSEETAKEIDQEVKRLIDEALSTCQKILTDHKDQLEKLGDALLERETLTAKEVYELLEMELPEHLQDHDKDDKGTPVASVEQKTEEKIKENPVTDSDISTDTGATGLARERRLI
ncbi:MAG: ATP-dependent zinc metalloprotease FtsH [Lentisphaeria bacterium]|nr:ATP-dependent zinc metalloprotease FtsH [Lentisphaeria bacterium]